MAGMFCGLVLAGGGADAPPKKAVNPEKEKVWKEVLVKYDANKDGRLDREERAKVSADDIKRMQNVGILAASPPKKKR